MPTAPGKPARISEENLMITSILYDKPLVQPLAPLNWEREFDRNAVYDLHEARAVAGGRAPATSTAPRKSP